jgi:hypothetical protein
MLHLLPDPFSLSLFLSRRGWPVRLVHVYIHYFFSYYYYVIFNFCTDLTITSKKLTELFSTMEDDKLDGLGFLLGLPDSKREEVNRNFHSPSQRREAYLDLYATDHPCPSWSWVVQALRVCGLHSQAGMVKNTYVQGNVHRITYMLTYI